MKKEELKKYVAEKYGEDFYPVYDEYTKKMVYSRSRTVYTAACDWCSIGGCFCEQCFNHSLDPYEQCGEVLTINGEEV